MNIWPQRLELKKETRQAAISHRRVTQSNLSWNWRQTIWFLTLKIPAPDPLDMYPCSIEWELNPSKISQEKRSWSCKTTFLNMTGAKVSTKGIWGMRVNSNPPISVSEPNKHPCPGQGCGFELPTVAIRWLVDLNRRAYLKCLWLRFLHRSC